MNTDATRNVANSHLIFAKHSLYLCGQCHTDLRFNGVLFFRGGAQPPLTMEGFVSSECFPVRDYKPCDGCA